MRFWLCQREGTAQGPAIAHISATSGCQRLNRSYERLGLCDGPACVFKADRVARVVGELPQPLNLIEGTAMSGIDLSGQDKKTADAEIKP